MKKMICFVLNLILCMALLTACAGEDAQTPAEHQTESVAEMQTEASSDADAQTEEESAVFNGEEF